MDSYQFDKLQRKIDSLMVLVGFQTFIISFVFILLTFNLIDNYQNVVEGIFNGLFFFVLIIGFFGFLGYFFAKTNSGVNAKQLV